MCIAASTNSTKKPVLPHSPFFVFLELCDFHFFLFQIVFLFRVVLSLRNAYLKLEKSKLCKSGQKNISLLWFSLIRSCVFEQFELCLCEEQFFAKDWQSLYHNGTITVYHVHPVCCTQLKKQSSFSQLTV